MSSTTQLPTDRRKPAVVLPASHRDVQYPPSEIPMSLRDWAIAGAIIAAVLILVPTNWHRVESLPVARDMRIPYELSGDYWLFDRLSREESGMGVSPMRGEGVSPAESDDNDTATGKMPVGRMGETPMPPSPLRPAGNLPADGGRVLVVGDSVVWGHYVMPEGTLSAQLNRRVGAERFVNLGVDGIHPAALAGLIEYYGGGVRGRDVILHCNLLWMSSPRHDLRERKAFAFNHPRMVPQLDPWIDCYDEKIDGRLAVAVGRVLPSSRLAQHVRAAYFGGADVPAWAMEHPYANPLAQITLRPLEGKSMGLPPGTTLETWTQRQLEPLAAQWVDLETSFQWASFQRAVQLLRGRGNRVFVVVGPFNEPMLTPAAAASYSKTLAGVDAWLTKAGVPHWIAPALPSDEYADASHPLAAGYARMAEQMLAAEGFKSFANAVAKEGQSK